MANKYQGEVKLKLREGKSVTLRLGLAELEELEELLDINLFTKIVSTMESMSLRMVTRVVMLGLRHSMPGITLDDVREMLVGCDLGELAKGCSLAVGYGLNPEGAKKMEGKLAERLAKEAPKGDENPTPVNLVATAGDAS